MAGFVILNVLDLFSGIGGFSLGLERATYADGSPGFRTIAFCESEPYAARVLRHHWPRVPIFRDVRSLGLVDLSLNGIPRPHVVCGGFPCQDISFAGRGAGLEGERSGLWFDMFRIIAELANDARHTGEPAPWAIVENVPALRTRGLDSVLRCFASIGYDAEWHCIPAAAVGAPHRRDRLWIIAYPDAAQRDWAKLDSSADSGTRRPGLADVRGNVPDAYGDNGRTGRPWRLDSGGAREPESVRSLPNVGASVCHAYIAGLAQRQGQPGNDGAELAAIIGTDWWESEPDVGRVAYGVPARVDRLGRLGNAVVPQIPEIIGRAILTNYVDSCVA